MLWELHVLHRCPGKLALRVAAELVKAYGFLVGVPVIILARVAVLRQELVLVRDEHTTRCHRASPVFKAFKNRLGV